MKYLRTHSFLPIIVASIAVLGIFVALFPKIFFVEAAPVSVIGWAWSDMPNGSNQDITPGNSQGGNGFGWITLDMGGANVSFDQGTGLFSGYAATEWVDWIQFNPTGTTPDGTSPGAFIGTDCLSGSTPTCPIEGWIRFLSGGTPQSGGWDGWVKMSTGSTHGVILDKATGNMTGYAWGGDVSGWIYFNAHIDLLGFCTDTIDNDGDGIIDGADTDGPETCGVLLESCNGIDDDQNGLIDDGIMCPNPGLLAVSASPNQLCKVGGDSVAWSVTNSTINTVCTTSSTGGSGFSILPPFNPPLIVSGTDIVSVNLNGSSSFMLSCTDPDPLIGTATATASFQCPIVPTSSIDVTLLPPSQVLNDCKTDTGSLSWTVLTTNSTPVSCTASEPNPGGYGFSGSVNSNGGTATINASGTLVNLTNQFGITCTDSQGNQDSDQVLVYCGLIPGDLCWNIGGNQDQAYVTQYNLTVSTNSQGNSICTSPTTCNNSQDDDGDNLIDGLDTGGNPGEICGSALSPIYQET